jgi:hypothetical protein
VVAETVRQHLIRSGGAPTPQGGFVQVSRLGKQTAAVEARDAYGSLLARYDGPQHATIGPGESSPPLIDLPHESPVADPERTRGHESGCAPKRRP